jgi:hypothetical protein
MQPTPLRGGEGGEGADEVCHALMGGWGGAEACLRASGVTVVTPLLLTPLLPPIPENKKVAQAIGW